MKIHKRVILSHTLYGCETWSITLRDKPTLRRFEKRVLRTISVSKERKLERQLHKE
jgi:predicted PP-loop superfamily ATPase